MYADKERERERVREREREREREGDEREGREWEVIRKGEKYDQIAFAFKNFSSCECSGTTLAELMCTGSDTPLSALNFIYLINSSFFYVAHICTTC